MSQSGLEYYSVFGPWTSATHLNKTSVAEGIKENLMKRYTGKPRHHASSVLRSRFISIYLPGIN